jgi:cell division protein FtsZ
MNVSMSDEFQSFDQRAAIKVCGIGGGGGNAVGRMIEAGLKDVEFVVVNTDAQALKNSKANTRLQIGVELAGGLGAGARPDVGRKAAEEDRERVKEVIRGADMVFLTAGLGGGTGTGASPIVAEEASAAGALTVAIVTLPFSFEGPERMENALQGLKDLEEHVDTLIVVPNDRVAELCKDNNMPMLNAFKQADEVLDNGIRAVSELITVPGLINVDFADVRYIMQARGRALMGIGMAEGDNRAVRAAEEAIVCPLLEQSNIHGAMGVIVNIRGGCDIGMREVQDAVTAVKKAAHPDANIIFGAVVDSNERPELQVTVIAAGFPKGISEELPARAADSFPFESAVPSIAPREEVTSEQEEEDSVITPFPDPTPEPEPVGPAGQQSLFNEEEEPDPQPAPEKDGDDLNLPTFLRNRLKRRQK